MSNNEHKPHAALPEEIQQLKNFWDNYGQHILTGICVILALILAYNLFNRWTGKKAEKQSFAHSQANTIEDYERFLADEGENYITPMARLNLAKALYRDGRYEDSLAKYNEIISGESLPELLNIAHLGKAASLEALKRTEEALSVFDAFCKENPDNYLYSISAMGVARCQYVNGDLDSAVDSLNALISRQDDKEGYWAQRAEMLIETFKRRKNAPERTQPEGAPSSILDSLNIPETPLPLPGRSTNVTLSTNANVALPAIPSD